MAVLHPWGMAMAEALCSDIMSLIHVNLSFVSNSFLIPSGSPFPFRFVFSATCLLHLSAFVFCCHACHCLVHRGLISLACAVVALAAIYFDCVRCGLGLQA